MAVQTLKYLVTADTKGFQLGMKAIGAAVAAAFVASIKIAADFEEQLSKVEGVTGATADEMKRLEKNARDLGKSTAFTASQVAGLEFELAKLGFTTDEIINSSGGILSLAAAMGVDLSDAAVLAGSTIRAFGLSTEETGRVTDVLAKSTASSALDFSKLTESLKLAAPIANLYNFTIEDTVAMLGQLANAGIHGSMAGTTLRQTFLELDKQGISLQEALDAVNNSANPAATALELVGKRAAGGLAILAQNEQAVKDLSEELYNAKGAADAIAETNLDNLNGDWTLMKSALEGLGIELGEIFIPLLRVVVKVLTKLIGFVQDALIGIKQFFVNIGEGLIKLAIAGLEAVVSLREIAGLDTSAARGQIDKLIEKLEELQKYGVDLGGGGSSDKNSGRKTNTVGAGGGGKKNKGGSISSDGLGFFGTGFNTVAGNIKTLQGNFEEFGFGVKDTFSSLGGVTAEFAKGFSNSSKIIVEDIKKTSEEVMELGQALQSSLTSAFTGIAQAIGEGLAEGFSADAFLSLLGKFMSQLGAAIIAVGVAELALKYSFANPWAAIAAGAALVIAGAAVTSARSGNPTGGGGSVRNVSSSISNTPINNVSATQNRNGSGAGQLVATVRGQDLRFALENANAIYGQTT